MHHAVTLASHTAIPAKRLPPLLLSSLPGLSFVYEDLGPQLPCVACPHHAYEHGWEQLRGGERPETLKIGGRLRGHLS